MKRVFVRLDYLLENAIAVTKNFNTGGCEVVLKNGTELELLNDVADQLLLSVCKDKNFRAIDSGQNVKINDK